MKIWYKGVLCNTGTYRYMGEDKPDYLYLREEGGGFWYAEK